MNKPQKLISLTLIIGMALVACHLPDGFPTEVAGGSPTPTPAVVTGITETPSPVPAAPISPTACNPTIATTTDANVRSGPGQVYNILGVIPTGGTAPVAGKNADGTWWYIQFAAGPGGYAWISGSVVTATCIPATLSVIAAPPTPVFTATNTTAPSVTPSVTPTTGLIIVLPPIFIIPSATPTFGFIFPIFPTIDCPFC